METLPSGVKKIQATDNGAPFKTAINANAALLDAIGTTTVIAERELEHEYEPSATNDTLVMILCKLKGVAHIAVMIGAEEVGAFGVSGAGVTQTRSTTFVCPAGAKYKLKAAVTGEGTVFPITARYTTLV